MAKKEKKEPMKFPTAKVIRNGIPALIFAGAAPLVETFVQNNVQTAAVMQGYAEGINTVAAYASSLPHLAALALLVIGIVFAIRVAKAIVPWAVEKLKEYEKEN